MKVKIEIGYNLLKAIQLIIESNEHLTKEYCEYAAIPKETTGESIQKALGIDITKLIIEVKK